jgi:NTE family protein
MTSTLSQKLVLQTEKIVLVLQGGGALGAYQCGVFEELTAVKVQPKWVAGVSIGAINGALIAGNAPERRLERLHEFWDLVTSGPARQALVLDGYRRTFNRWSATCAALFGVPGFYTPRFPPAFLQPEGAAGAVSVYDTKDLRSTLERLIDFDRINAKTIRLSIGAVNVATGNSKWFDNFDPKTTIGPEHIMASGALPPAFAPVVIDGESYWDGGVLSNTPLQYVLDQRGDERLAVVQIDLFSARGSVPTDLSGTIQRHKDILYSSRSRFTTEKIAELQRLKGSMRRLLQRMPDKLRNDPDLRALERALHAAPVDIVHLIYRQSAFEGGSKDYEFSRVSMRERWASGIEDMRRTHQHLDQLEPSDLGRDVTVYDVGQGFNAASQIAAPPERPASVKSARADTSPANDSSSPRMAQRGSRRRA